MSVENILQSLSRPFQSNRRRAGQTAPSAAAVESLETRSLLTLIGMTATVSSGLQTSSGAPETSTSVPNTAIVSDDAANPEFPGFNNTYNIDIAANSISMDFSGSNTGPAQVVPAGTFHRYRFRFNLAPNETIASASAAATSSLVPNVTVSGNTITAEIGPGMRIGTGFNALINVNLQRSGTVIMGRKFHDANNDSVRSSGEAWLNGWTMELRDLNQNGDVVATTLSRDVDLNGNGQIDPATESGVYIFENVPAGTFVLQENLFDGWAQSLPSNANVAKAFELDQQLQLKSNANEYLNWGGLNEKWFSGRKSAETPSETAWYYMTPDGTVYQWDHSPRTALTGTVMATLDASYYENLSLLLEAPSSRQYVVDVDATSAMTFRERNFGNYLAPPAFINLNTVADQVANTLTFNWDAKAGASYDIWISDIAANRQFQYIPELDGTDIPLITQLPDRRYRVWIRTNSQGATSPWSPAYEFELLRDPVSIITGGTQSNTVDATPTIQWQAVNTASSYDVRVLDANDDVVYLGTKAQGTSHRIATALMFGKNYRVAVRANFADGSRTAWDDGVPLQINGRPTASVNGNIVSWAAVPAATSYQVWVNRLDEDGNLLKAQVVYANNVHAVNYEMPIVAAGHYAVWIRAIRSEDGFNAKSLWSPQVNFQFTAIESPSDSQQTPLLDSGLMLTSLGNHTAEVADTPAPQPVPQFANGAADADLPDVSPPQPATAESEDIVAAVLAELADSDALYHSQS